MKIIITIIKVSMLGPKNNHFVYKLSLRDIVADSDHMVRAGGSQVGVVGGGGGEEGR